MVFQIAHIDLKSSITSYLFLWWYVNFLSFKVLSSFSFSLLFDLPAEVISSAFLFPIKSPVASGVF